MSGVLSGAKLQCCPDYMMFICWDCTACTNCDGEYYMVHDELWEYATEDFGGDGMLCIGCLENRLGGLLTSDDFTDAPLNSMNLFCGSDRLRSRLTQVSNPAIV
jgi:hypothetical protein